jgi:hypothetical protein
MEPTEIAPYTLWRRVARAMYRSDMRSINRPPGEVPEPNRVELEDAAHLVAALLAEGIECRPVDPEDDMTLSEEGA